MSLHSQRSAESWLAFPEGTFKVYAPPSKTVPPIRAGSMRPAQRRLISPRFKKMFVDNEPLHLFEVLRKTFKKYSACLIFALVGIGIFTICWEGFSEATPIPIKLSYPYKL